MREWSAEKLGVGPHAVQGSLQRIEETGWCLGSTWADGNVVYGTFFREQPEAAQPVRPPHHDAKNLILNVTVAGGKYTVLQHRDGSLHALRHGQQWRDCCGDNLVFHLAAELEEDREKLRKITEYAVAERKAKGTVMTPQALDNFLNAVTDVLTGKE